MKTTPTFWAAPLLSLLGLISLSSQALTSPDGKLKLEFQGGQASALSFALQLNGKPVLQNSALGVGFDTADFTQKLTIVSQSAVELDTEKYAMHVGKRSQIQSQANLQHLIVENDKKQRLDITFRLANDGLAFRYFYLNNEHKPLTFTRESTSFAFPAGTLAFMQPMSVAQTGWSNTNPSYEEYYERDIPVGTPSPSPAGWVFPALYKQGDTWVLLSEAGMDGTWHGSRLQADSTGGIYKIGSPMAAEVFTKGALLANTKADSLSPWRIVGVGSLATLMESTLGTDVAAPAIPFDETKIYPGHSSWSWAILKDDYTTYDVQKKFIDYAAEMHWDYTLIDADWDRKIGFAKLKELCDYAATKNVRIIVWYNSSGDWNVTPYTPKSKLLTHEQRQQEFARLSAIGVKGLKIDFFGGDGQSMIAYYTDILKDAADAGMMVNFHGATLPRGWQRTYPNLMTMEAIKGFEFATFTQENQNAVVKHAVTAPFVRNIYDPMDFTPMVFGDIPNIKRATRNSFELAESIIFISGIQHFAEIPEGMATVPAYVKGFLQDLPRQWDDVKFIEGYPGKYIVVARRAGAHWYLAAMNGEDQDKTVTLDLSFIQAKTGLLIQDAGERAFTKQTISNGKKVSLTLKGRGGAVAVF